MSISQSVQHFVRQSSHTQSTRNVDFSRKSHSRTAMLQFKLVAFSFLFANRLNAYYFSWLTRVDCWWPHSMRARATVENLTFDHLWFVQRTHTLHQAYTPTNWLWLLQHNAINTKPKTNSIYIALNCICKYNYRHQQQRQRWRRQCQSSNWKKEN